MYRRLARRQDPWMASDGGPAASAIPAIFWRMPTCAGWHERRDRVVHVIEGASPALEREQQVFARSAKRESAGRTRVRSGMTAKVGASAAAAK